MTLAENVRLPLEEFTDLPDDAMDLIARMKLDLVGSKDFAEHLPAEVSGGMQKRAAIARAMAMDPQSCFWTNPLPASIRSPQRRARSAHHRLKRRWA